MRLLMSYYLIWRNYILWEGGGSWRWLWGSENGRSQGIKPLCGCVTIYGHLRQCTHRVLMFATASLVIVTRVYGIRFTHNLSTAASTLVTFFFSIECCVIPRANAEFSLLFSRTLHRLVTLSRQRAVVVTVSLALFTASPGTLALAGTGGRYGHTATCCCAASGIPAAAAPLPVSTGHAHSATFF